MSGLIGYAGREAASRDEWDLCRPPAPGREYSGKRRRGHRYEKRQAAPLSGEQIAQAARLWRVGRNSGQIADELYVLERFVVAALPRIRAQAAEILP